MGRSLGMNETNEAGQELLSFLSMNEATIIMARQERLP